MDKSDEHASTYSINIVTGDITSANPSTSGVPILVQSGTETVLPAIEMPPPPDPNTPSSSKGVLEKVKPPGKMRGKETVEKNSEEYIRRRQRNNVAVRKSREKTREKSAYTLQKVEQLKTENEHLESKIATLTKELSVLKDLFMEHARGFCGTSNSVHLSPEQLEKLLGCKAIRTNLNAETPSEGHAVKPEPTPALSTIQPLINAAEIGLMGMEGDIVAEEQIIGSNTVIYDVTDNCQNVPHQNISLVKKDS